MHRAAPRESAARHRAAVPADELEIDAEHAQVGGVAAELGVGCGHAEIEPPGVSVVARRARRCQRWLGLAYLADARYAESLPVEELHAHVIALEAAVATKS